MAASGKSTLNAQSACSPRNSEEIQFGDEKRLLIGPWDHVLGSAGAGFDFGLFASTAGVDFDGQMERYFDYYLKDEENGVPDDASIRLYVMGAKPGHLILDVGCGNGDDVRALAQIVGAGGWLRASTTAKR